MIDIKTLTEMIQEAIERNRNEYDAKRFEERKQSSETVSTVTTTTTLQNGMSAITKTDAEDNKLSSRLGIDQIFCIAQTVQVDSLEENLNKDHISAEDKHGQNLMHLASLNNDLAMVRCLIKNGMKFDASLQTDKSGLSPLLIAMYYFATEKFDVHNNIFSYLLDGDEDNTLINSCTAKGCPPLLHLSVLLDDFGLFEDILGRGADVDAVDKRGNSALHYAAMLNRSEMLSVLLQSKANATLVNDDGLTATNLAENYRSKACLKLLSVSASSEAAQKVLIVAETETATTPTENSEDTEVISIELGETVTVLNSPSKTAEKEGANSPIMWFYLESFDTSGNSDSKNSPLKAKKPKFNNRA